MIMPYKYPGRRTSWCCGESGLSAEHDPDTNAYSLRSMYLSLRSAVVSTT